MARGTETSSNKKHCKISTKNENVPSLDRLSELPDSVLCHILSFLPTKQSAATSILGRRWRFLWADVPNLYMRDYEHDFSKGEPSFSDVMNRIFISYNVQVMNAFTLKCMDDNNSINEYQIETWITAAVSREVRQLDISLSCHLLIPRCLFTCKTLVDLTLKFCALPSLPSSICLPSLKKLILKCVACDFDENFSRLISGCPVLEGLEIYGIGYANFHCSICSPTIKWLHFCFTFEKLELDRNNYRLVINTPALRYLQIQDYLSPYISTEAPNSLVEAHIKLRLHEEAVIREPEDHVDYYGTLLEFIRRLCNAECLALSIDYKKILDSAFVASHTRFHNLTKLQLSADWRFISKFLESADNLEILIIGTVEGVLKRWREPKQVPSCLLSKLTTIKIHKFGLTENETEMVRYLLKNAQVLKVMTIYSRATTTDYKKKFGALQKISEFERGSAACKLYFK